MPDHAFLFEIDLSGESRFEGMLMVLGNSVLCHFGYPAGVTTEALAALQAEWTRSAAEGTGRCHIQFRAVAGELQIVVAHAGGREWRIARPLP